MCFPFMSISCKWPLSLKYCRCLVLALLSPELHIAMRFSHRYFRVFHIVISGFFSSIFQSFSHRYFRVFASLFQSFSHRYFRVFRIVISELFASLFQSFSHRYFRVFRIVISELFAPLFQSFQ